MGEFKLLLTLSLLFPIILLGMAAVSGPPARPGCERTQIVLDVVAMATMYALISCAMGKAPSTGLILQTSYIYAIYLAVLIVSLFIFITNKKEHSLYYANILANITWVLLGIGFLIFHVGAL